MEFSTANNEFMLLVLLVLVALFSRESKALLSNLALKAQPHTKSLQVRQSSYQENPSFIQWPPDCTIQDATSCLGSEAVSSCTVETCSKKVAATCWTHVYFIDFQCLCGSMSSTTCPYCNGGVNRELYLAWLSQYCTKDPGWDGLPNNWNDVLPAFEVLEAGEVNAVHQIDQSHFQTQNPFTSQFITDKHTFIDDHHVPTCISLCNWLNVKWASSFVDGNVSAGLVAGGFNPTYQQGGALQAGVLYVDLSLFCTGWKWSDLQSGCPNLCTANLEPTSLLLWLNTTCGQTSGFAGLPNDWTDSLAVFNSTYTSPFSGPSCAQGGNDSNCDIPSAMSSCTRSLCESVDQNGDCNAVSMVNMECFCSSIQYNGCIASGGQCSSSLQQTGLLLWLNTTCSNVQGFVGLPNNWQDSLYVLNSTYTDVFARPTCLGDSNYPGCTIDSTESTCTKTLCGTIDANGDCTSVNKVNETCYCSELQYSSCTASNGTCNSSIDETGLYLWLNSTCGNIPSFSGLPNNWENSIALINNTYAETNSFPWPSCLDTTHPDCQLQSTETSCTKTLCNGTDGHGNCYPVSLVDMPCFCSQTRYGSSCKENCGLSWQRADYLNWLNNTCSSQIAPGIILPLNWTSYLSVQRSDLLPWSWKVAFDAPTNSTSQHQCPSAAAELLTFAAANLFMLFLLAVIFFALPFVGQRIGFPNLRLGCFGHQWSQRWYITGPLIVCFQLLSNAINAAIVKATPGFSQTSIKELTLFWCTRPRITWLLIIPLLFQPKRPALLSATYAIVFSEAILQLFAGYLLGTGLDFARRQKFYLEGHLSGSGFAKDARMMYAGSIIWVWFVPFAVFSALWIVLDGNKKMGWLDMNWVEISCLAKDKVAFANEEVDGLGRLQKEIKGRQDHLSSDIDTLIDEWDQLKDTWQSLPSELRKQHENHRKIQKNAELATFRFEGCREGTKSWQVRREAKEEAEYLEERSSNDWLAITTIEARQRNNRANQPRQSSVSDNQSSMPSNNTATTHRTEARQRQSNLRTQIAVHRSDNSHVGRYSDTGRGFWEELIRHKEVLLKDWGLYEELWIMIVRRRKEREGNMGRVMMRWDVLIFAAAMGMLYIAMWLWWSGFVRVAGDEYCVMRLPLLGFLWALFGLIGLCVGAIF